MYQQCNPILDVAETFKHRCFFHQNQIWSAVSTNIFHLFKCRIRPLDLHLDSGRIVRVEPPQSSGARASSPTRGGRSTGRRWNGFPLLQCAATTRSWRCGFRRATPTTHIGGATRGSRLERTWMISHEKNSLKTFGKKFSYHRYSEISRDWEIFQVESHGLDRAQWVFQCCWNWIAEWIISSFVDGLKLDVIKTVWRWVVTRRPIGGEMAVSQWERGWQDRMWRLPIFFRNPSGGDTKRKVGHATSYIEVVFVFKVFK